MLLAAWEACVHAACGILDLSIFRGTEHVWLSGAAATAAYCMEYWWGDGESVGWVRLEQGKKACGDGQSEMSAGEGVWRERVDM